MKKVIEFLKSIPSDKLLHFIAGVIISQLVCAIYAAISHPSYGGCLIGFLVALAAGIAKELYDEFHKETETPEFMDFIYTCAGGLVSSLISLIYVI